MSIGEKASTFLGKDESGPSLWQILGPLFIICAFALAPKDPLIQGAAIVGLCLSARWHLRGLSYALILLGAAAVAEHLFFASRHFWQLGFEISYGIAFFITALAAEQKFNFIKSLTSQIDANGASIRNLEDDLMNLREAATQQQIGLQDRVALLTKEIEEMQSEHSSILILNEVLRKTAAAEGAEKDRLKQELFAERGNLFILQNEIQETKKELSHWRDSEALAIQNRELTAQINAARVDREQARLIGETVARLHAKEALKAKEAAEKLTLFQEENQKLSSRLSSMERESEAFTAHLEQMNEERERYKLALDKLEEVQSDRNYLKERLEKAEIELSQRKESLIPPEELTYLREKVVTLTKIEPLYKQLKAQFEEKNQILHETRIQLFRSETEREMLKIEKEQKEQVHDPINEKIKEELFKLEEDLSHLEQENQDLEELITALTESGPPQAESSSEEPLPIAPAEKKERKKKVKKKPDPEQEMLF